MKITMESTSQLVTVAGRETRRWMGTTGAGIEVDVFVPMIRVRSEQDLQEFERELKEMPEPEFPPIDLRFLI